MQVHDVGPVPDGVELLQPDDQDDHLLAEALGDRGDDGLHGLRLRLLPLLVDGEENMGNIWSPWIISYHVRLGRTTTVATEILDPKELQERHRLRCGGIDRPPPRPRLEDVLRPQPEDEEDLLHQFCIDCDP